MEKSINSDNEAKKETIQAAANRSPQAEDDGQLTLTDGETRIHLLNIIGEVEGHECLPASSKTTKYEHVLPQLAALEDSRELQGLWKCNNKSQRWRYENRIMV